MGVSSLSGGFVTYLTQRFGGREGGEMIRCFGSLQSYLTRRFGMEG